MNIFLEYEDFVDIILGHHKIGLYLGVISMHFRGFSLRYRKGVFLWVAKISNIFRVLEILDIFGMYGRCWTGAYV